MPETENTFAKRNTGAPKISDRIKLDMAVLKARLASLPAGLPHSLFIGLTSRCDLSCRHCKYAGGHAAARGDMPQSLLSRVLESAAGLGIPRVIFFGGEPLLYPRLETAVRKAAALGLFTELDTNGQSLSAARLGGLAAAGLSSVMISLHSTEPAAHERISGPGTFARAERAVKAAVAGGLVTYVSACIFSADLEGPGLKRLVSFAKARGALGARLLPYSPPSGLSRLPGRLARRLHKASPDGYARSCVSGGSRFCDAQRGRLLFISRNGEVSSCPYVSRSLGSLKSASLAALLAKKRLPAAKAGFPCQDEKKPA